MRLFFILLFLFTFTAEAAHVSQVQIFNATSLGATVASPGVDVGQMTDTSFQAVWTGTPTGNITIEASNDIVDDASKVVNWITISGSTVAAGGAAGSALWNLSNHAYKWLRLKYTRTGSTGTITSIIFSKG